MVLNATYHRGTFALETAVPRTRFAGKGKSAESLRSYSSRAHANLKTDATING